MLVSLYEEGVVIRVTLEAVGNYFPILATLATIYVIELFDHKGWSTGDLMEVGLALYLASLSAAFALMSNQYGVWPLLFISAVFLLLLFGAVWFSYKVGPPVFRGRGEQSVQEPILPRHSTG